MKGYPTLYDGILFLECEAPQLLNQTPIKEDLSFVLGAQLKSLNDVKRGLAAQARSYGCNCVASFQYGQKSRWLAIDNVAFWGSGIAGNLSEAEYSKYVEHIFKRDNT